jgi:hypothetical protein
MICNDQTSIRPFDWQVKDYVGMDVHNAKAYAWRRKSFVAAQVGA